MDKLKNIKKNVGQIKSTLPEGVTLEAAAKTRTVEEVNVAIEAGVDIIGENYLQEAAAIREGVKKQVPLHFIGHLQRNKAKKAVEIFDMIETIDSPRLAKEVNKRCRRINKVMPVLIEVNSGREEQKYGIFPEDVESFVRETAAYEHLKIRGLMTMGPFTGNPEAARPYFRETKACFDTCAKLGLENVEMEILSMGMTNSYKVAIEEGATLVRIGTKLFGPREK